MNNLEQNFYSSWESTEDLLNKQRIETLGIDDTITTTGLPVGSTGDKIIVDNSNYNTLIIGSTGSGKTQSTVLPMLYQSAKSGESVLITDQKGELYQIMAKEYENNGFNVIYINLNNPEVSSCWNPLALPKTLYDLGDKDKACDLIESTMNYLLKDENVNADPFWSNTATQYLTGIILGLLENGTPIDKINFKTISKFTTEYENEVVIDYINSIDKNSVAYQFLAGTHLAPPETKASIISVLNQKLVLLISREKLISLLSKSDFDIANIRNNKTAIFFTYDNTKLEECALFNGFFEQVNYVLNNDMNTKPFNIILDTLDFNNIPIKNFTNRLDGLRSSYVRVTMLIRGLDVLTNIYGKENIDLLKYQCSNILYLMSNDLKTIEFISEFCGKKNNDEYLVSPEALRRMPEWNCILIKNRCLPYYGTLVPFYKMGINIEKKEFEKRNLPEVNVLDI